MNKRLQRCVDGWARVAVAGSAGIAIALSAPAAHAQTPEQIHKMTQSNVRLGAANGRMAVDLCSFDAQTQAQYKDWVKRQAPDSTFDADWNQGWTGGVRLLTLFKNGQKTDPANYEETRAQFCKDIKADMTSS